MLLEIELSKKGSLNTKNGTPVPRMNEEFMNW